MCMYTLCTYLAFAVVGAGEESLLVMCPQYLCGPGRALGKGGLVSESCNGGYGRAGGRDEGWVGGGRGSDGDAMNKME